MLDFNTLPNAPFICGDSFRSIARYRFDEMYWRSYPLNQYTMNDEGFESVYFVQTEYLDMFLKSIYEKDIKKKPYYWTLITHNSDINITERYKEVLDIPNLKKWFAQNVMYKHYKLNSIPIGIPNPKWQIGQADTFKEVMDEKIDKIDMVCASYDIHTNLSERRYCQEQTGIKILKNGIQGKTTKKEHKEYLQRIASHYFSLCPNGNGIDTHRIWESLYMRTIPICSDSINIRFYEHYPIIILKDWGEFKSLELSEALYKEKWSIFEPLDFSFEKWIKKGV